MIDKDKLIESQASEIAELELANNQTVGDLYELQSHINVLREALENLIDYVEAAEPNCTLIEKVKTSIIKTPAQHINDDMVIFDKKSLQAHDDEVLELAAKVCEGVSTSSEVIRALKHT